MENNQKQKAGDNSQQIQADLIVVNQGIDEKRAREIYMEMFENARRDFSIEAAEEVKRRVLQFEEDLIPKMQKIEGALQAFADPAFQIMLTAAHKSAAVTESKDDYSILSELLIHRIKKGNDRKSIAGISRAIDIVSEIPDDALLGLTVQYAFEIIIPQSGNITVGLDALEKLFSTLIYDELPEGSGWIEQLDVLNAVRITDFSSFKKLDEYYSEQLNGYCCIGIKKDSENYNRAVDLLKQNNLNSLLAQNEFNEEYVRLLIVNDLQIDKLNLNSLDLTTGRIIKRPLSNNEKDILHQVFSMYENDNTLKNEIKEKFVSEIDKRPNLVKIKNWIDKIPMSFNTTPIGKVLANANAQRCNKEFPPLN